MKIFFESDRECTINGVGLLEPGKPVEVDPELFTIAQGVKPAEAHLPHFVKVTVDVSEGGE
jgi:hypothetical protein